MRRGVVLLIDDDPDVRTLATLVLTGEGFDVVGHASGPAALEWLHRTAEVPDGVVLDVQMPEMDGWTVLEKLRSDERTGSVPVLMFTVKAGEQDRERARSTGADGYLSKPFTIDGLTSVVRELIGCGDRVARSEPGNS